MPYFTEPVFTPGQQVVATGRLGGYEYHLTAGKTYTVTKYEPPVADPGFTWPAYVADDGDVGRPVVCHTYRFRPADAQPGD